MPRKIFYSWQSWLPSVSNRILVHDALEAACDESAANLTEAQRPEIDHDTLGVPGAPDIAQTIFAKIDSCDAFVADVSLIHCDADKRRLTPNPNVLLELGYAIKTLGWEQILLVLNTHFGSPEALPFDLKTKRAVPYRIDPLATAESIAAERKQLQADLKKGLVSLLARTTPRAERTRTAEAVRYLQLIKSEATEMAERAKELNQMLYSRGLPRDEWADRLLRLLRLRFHPEVIDGALAHIASELDAHRVLREQLNALRKTAHAADRETARFVKQWDELSQWGDVGPMHRLAQELMTPAQLVVQLITERLAAIEKAP